MFSSNRTVRYTPLFDSSVPSRHRRVTAIIKWIICTLGLLAVAATTWLLWKPTLGSPRGPEIFVPTIPSDPKVVGLVFYGRRSRVSILDCYLKRNLVENGGRLNEVIFVARTDNVEDLQWLDRLVETSKSYSRFNLTENGGKASEVDYGKVWDLVLPGVLYIKIDDDVVFIDNSTIPRLIDSKIAHPEHLLTSANVINNPALSWVHYHLGVIRPYLPELTPPPLSSPTSWRASKLPLWAGDSSFFLHQHVSPPFRNHRWLPLGPGYYNLDGTPITLTAYSDHGAGWKNWAVAAQEHYSFLEHLEKGDVDQYHFGTWDYQYERLSINMIAVWGDDIVNNRPVPNDDEKWLTVQLPKKLGRHAVIDGKAVASHYAFRSQTRYGKGLEWTDVLDRYRAYADENVCTT